MSDWQHPVQQQNPSQQQDSREADPTVLAFAAAVAELLMRHIVKQMPPSVAEALRQMVQQQIAQETAEAAAAGRQPTMTATLQQLLPQLSQSVAHANRLGPSFGSAAAVAASAVQPKLPGSSLGGMGAGELTRFDPITPQQQQQQQQQHQGGVVDGILQEGSPLCVLRSTTAHNPTAVTPNSARSQLLFDPPSDPAAAAAGSGSSGRCFAEPLPDHFQSLQQRLLQQQSQRGQHESQLELTASQLDQQLQMLQQQLLLMLEQQHKQQQQHLPQRQQEHMWVSPQSASPSNAAPACSDCSSSCA